MDVAEWEKMKEVCEEGTARLGEGCVNLKEGTENCYHLNYTRNKLEANTTVVSHAK